MTATTMTDATLPSSAETVPRRAHQLVPWMFCLVALAFVVTTLVSGSLPDPWWRWALIVVGLAGAVAVWGNQLPLAIAVVLAFVSIRLGTAPAFGTEVPLDAAWEMGVTLTIKLGLCVLVIVALRHRRSRIGVRDLVDVIAILIGTLVVAWIAVAHPLLDDSLHSPTFAVLVAVYLAATSFFIVVAVDIAFSGLFGNRSIWFAGIAGGLHVVASWAWALGAVGTLPDTATQLGVAGNAAALCLVAAALTHPEARGSLTPVDHGRGGTDSLVRVVSMSISVAVPITMVAAIPPSSATDAVVRASGIGLLVSAIVARLWIAAHQNREVRDALLQQVTRDDLTQLPNRTRFIDDVAGLLETTWHTAHRVTVVKLNLDRFKNINDSYGHYAANEVLVVIGDRLRAAADQLGASVARVGGDDFAMVLGGITSTDEAIARADAVRVDLASPINIGDATVFVTASMGVALAARNRTIAAEDLLRYADIAAHHAKQNGRNRVELFDESMQSRLTRRMDVEHALHGAIGRQEMRLFHQPIVDIVTGRVSGFEALMRWERLDGTLVSPADFIPVAEETGIICELGAWALRDALSSLRQWIDDGLVAPTTTMSVNVSPRQIADPAFTHVVRTAISESGVPPHLLWVEITESMMLDEPDLAAHTLEEVRSMGVRIAMDDFGTGFSSLSVLQQFPIQRIKIDRAFVQGIGGEGNDRSLVRTIIAMARSMALDLVAEGVETVEQLEALRELGCDKAQGYLISRPVPADAIRSTVVALDEMASLSIFASGRVDESFVGPLPEPVHAAPRVRQFATVGPIGRMSSRPLGGPMI